MPLSLAARRRSPPSLDFVGRLGGNRRDRLVVGSRPSRRGGRCLGDQLEVGGNRGAGALLAAPRPMIPCGFAAMSARRWIRALGRRRLQPHWHRLRRNLKISSNGELTMSTAKPIRRVAIIGTGVIGASWAALFLAKDLAEVGSRSIDELAAERDEMLLGLIELRMKVENTSAALVLLAGDHRRSGFVDRDRDRARWQTLHRPLRAAFFRQPYALGPQTWLSPPASAKSGGWFAARDVCRQNNRSVDLHRRIRCARPTAGGPPRAPERRS